MTNNQEQIQNTNVQQPQVNQQTAQTTSISTDSQSQKPDYRKLRHKKVCYFCKEKILYIDYKDTARLRKFMNDRAKILNRRQTGTCAKHQRMLTRAIKRARNIALLPFTII